METPDRNQIGTPLSKFEESPVFSYINNLSPIKPVKSVHATQTFNSLSFSSPLSVFTSPHVSSHRVSRFLRSHNIADLTKPKVLLEEENNVSTEDVSVDAINTHIDSNEDNDETDIRVADASIHLPKEDTDFTIELPKEFSYESGSPDCEQITFCGDENRSALQLPSKEVSLVASVPGAENEPSEEEVQVVQMSDICCIEPKVEDAECNWESLIPDASDLLIFNSPNDIETFKDFIQRPLDPAMQFCTMVTTLSPNDINGQKLHVVDQTTSSQCITDCHSSHTETACEQTEFHHSLNTRDYENVALMDSNKSEQDNKSVFIMHCGFRRRCLDFEMTGGWKKTPNEGSSSDSYFPQSDEKITTNHMQIVPSKQNSDSRKCILPGIGLHLNSLAALRDHRDNRHGSWQSACSSILLPTTSQGHLLSEVTPPEGDMIDADKNEAQLAEDGSQPSSYSHAEDYSQSSPKKKRSKLEVGGESDGCKRCNCKKSKCLKLYCECFAAGIYCIEPCTCQDCFNKPIHEDKVLETRKQIESRNPLAFAPKVIRNSDSAPEKGDESNKTPASARHKRGCNCKKSNCLKKYCECYQGGVGCSDNCRCEGCKNKFGTKDGSIPHSIESEPEETCENGTVGKRLKEMDIQNNEEHLAGTPLRSPVPLPFPSKGKPPRSSFISRGLYAGNRIGKSNVVISQQKLVKHLETVPDDEMQEVLRGDWSPVSCMKTSPNGKRVSSPHCNFAGSPTRRSGRKLILQSIPSFPSLT